MLGSKHAGVKKVAPYGLTWVCGGFVLNDFWLEEERGSFWLKELRGALGGWVRPDSIPEGNSGRGVEAVVPYSIPSEWRDGSSLSNSICARSVLYKIAPLRTRCAGFCIYLGDTETLCVTRKKNSPRLTLGKANMPLVSMAGS